MNKVTKEIASILESQIKNQPEEVQINGLSTKQIDEINDFVNAFIRNGIGPFPMKLR